MIVLACWLSAVCAADQGPLVFERERIGTGTFESASAFDVNKDGHLDVVSGDQWFEGPDFTKAHKTADVDEYDTYYDHFSTYPMDVDGDSCIDFLTGGWFGKRPRWAQNPCGSDHEWVETDLPETGNIERSNFWDLDGDGYVEMIATTKPVHIFRLKRDADGKGLGEFDHHIIDKEEGIGGHGQGFGDINGDGRSDMLFATGWLEAPKDPKDTYNSDAWKWHQAWEFGQASVPILVHDVNGDGLNDIIVGQGHNYGLDWYAQARDADGNITWEKHVVETKISQFHVMDLADIDNDGELELVTGKRYRGHNGNDPGSEDPLGLYYYEINGGDFLKTTIDYGPAGTASGTGLYMWIEDLDGNGWKDILAPGKEGLYLFRNKGPLTTVVP